MDKIIKPLVLGYLLFSSFIINAQNPLKECWNLQVNELKNGFLKLDYQEKLNRLGHNFKPWKQTKYSGKGNVWSSQNIFMKQDTLVRGRRSYHSKTSLNQSEFLFLDYGDDTLLAVTEEMFLDKIFNSARYSPVYLINYFVKNNITADSENNTEFAIYKTQINHKTIQLFVRKKDYLLEQVTILSHDDLYGDVLSIFRYSDFGKVNKTFFPKKIKIEKINGKIIDEVIVNHVNFIENAIPILERPANYKFEKEKIITPKIATKKYNNNIHLIELEHTDDRVMVVEFSDFLLIAEAPINSKNGDLIIIEAKKIAPNKPIKYFVFGHHHPHYIGGVRSFIQQGAKVICSKENEEYLKYIATAPHTLKPDQLQKYPKQLQIELIKDQLTITDGKLEMIIYFIGEKSEHTNDYLIYYFPNQKLLFQDDLVWIADKGEIKKARKRQAGLYNSIIELDLEVDTIIQSWPVADYGVKTIIPFKDLEKSMNIK